MTDLYYADNNRPLKSYTPTAAVYLTENVLFPMPAGFTMVEMTDMRWDKVNKSIQQNVFAYNNIIFLL